MLSPCFGRCKLPGIRLLVFRKRVGDAECSVRLGLHRLDHQSESMWIDEIVGVDVFQQSARGEPGRSHPVGVVSEIILILEYADPRVASSIP
jgi:hypothetical protein